MVRSRAYGIADRCEQRSKCGASRVYRNQSWGLEDDWLRSDVVCFTLLTSRTQLRAVWLRMLWSYRSFPPLGAYSGRRWCMTCDSTDCTCAVRDRAFATMFASHWRYCDTCIELYLYSKSPSLFAGLFKISRYRVFACAASVPFSRFPTYQCASDMAQSQICKIRRWRHMVQGEFRTGSFKYTVSTPLASGDAAYANAELRAGVRGGSMLSASI